MNIIVMFHVLILETSLDDEIVYPSLDHDRQSCGFSSVYTYYTAKLVNAVSGI